MAYAPDRDSCANCLHFVIDSEDEGSGECRRYPPIYMARAHTCAFVTVAAANVCGEFDSLISDDHAKNCH